MEEKPTYLYHYTNIHALAMILQNRTIRFSMLCNMDDLQEQCSADIQNFGRFVFICSWTEEEKEDIPMWRMYTKKGEGIRIKLKANPLKQYEIVTHTETGDSTRITVIPYKDYFNDNYMVMNYYTDKILYKMKYTNDANIPTPTIMNVANNTLNLNIVQLGHHKNVYWTFQKEWRYIVVILPISIKNSLMSTGDLFKVMNCFQTKVSQGQAALPFDYYYLELAYDAFTDMEIMLSPDISESSRILVNLLVEKHNPNARVIQSELLGKLR